ncbi:hypothetical protein HN011_004468 [Eciton burchellii]|nr:hypothetical protein HN011_004468 [Eciton burchellii]
MVMPFRQTLIINGAHLRKTRRTQCNADRRKEGLPFRCRDRPGETQVHHGKVTNRTNDCQLSRGWWSLIRLERRR